MGLLGVAGVEGILGTSGLNTLSSDALALAATKKEYMEIDSTRVTTVYQGNLVQVAVMRNVTHPRGFYSRFIFEGTCNSRKIIILKSIAILECTCISDTSSNNGMCILTQLNKPMIPKTLPL